MNAYWVIVTRQATVAVLAGSAGEALQLAEDLGLRILQEETGWTEEYRVLSCQPEPRIKTIQRDG